MSYAQVYKNKRKLNTGILDRFNMNDNLKTMFQTASNQYNSYMKPMAQVTDYYNSGSQNQAIQNYQNAMQQQNQNAYKQYVETSSKEANNNMVANARAGANRMTQQDNIQRQLQAYGMGNSGMSESSNIALNNNYLSQVNQNNQTYNENVQNAYDNYMNQVNSNVAQSEAYEMEKMTALLGSAITLEDYNLLRDEINNSQLINANDKQSLLTQLQLQANNTLSDTDKQVFNGTTDSTNTPTINGNAITLGGKQYSVNNMNDNTFATLMDSLNNSSARDGARYITQFLHNVNAGDEGNYKDEKVENRNQTYAIQKLMNMVTGEDYKMKGNIDTQGGGSIIRIWYANRLSPSQMNFLKELGFRQQGNRLYAPTNGMDERIVNVFKKYITA